MAREENRLNDYVFERQVTFRHAGGTTSTGRSAGRGSGRSCAEAGAEVAPLSEQEKAVHEAGLVSVLKDIHDAINGAVFAAYGWEDLGGRLVALNRERAADEKRGIVHWLRPEFQKPRLAHKVEGELDIAAEQAEAGAAEERPWPADGLAQIRTVRDVLAEAGAPLPAPALAALFKGRTTAKRKARVAEVLETLVSTGAARESDGSYFLPR